MRFSFLILSASIATVAMAEAATDVVYNRDVLPILSDKCFACHGFDPKTREADLRLDTFEGATADAGGYSAIVPGNPDKSEAWKRIITTDEDDLMPPKKSHKDLSAKEKDVLKRWIEQGAKYQKHWAFEPIQKPEIPTVQNAGWAKNPIDRFVLARLESAKLAPAPEADRRTLGRRVALDLTGLPPAPGDLDAFLKDESPDAYEKYVRRLMDSPAWGEHRGRYWLDAARYADTHGLHFDNYREMWPYRDWVISAFNKNLPFDAFTIEQLAGDLLPKPSRDQLIATGFQRCNATTNEGGTIDDENLANYANDRVTTMSWVWLGLSTNCAACHDHKFDPVTQKDFYSLAAFFRNTTQPPKDGNIRDSKPVLYLPKGEDEKRFTEITTQLAEKRKAQTERRAAAEKEFESWYPTATAKDLEISKADLALHFPLKEGKGEELTATTPEALKVKAPTVQWVDGGKLGKAPALSADGSIEVGDFAGFEKDQPFTVTAWVRVPKGTTKATLVGRFDDRGQTRKGWFVFAEDNKFGIRLSPGDSKAEIRAQTRKNTVKGDTWQHVAVVYDGSGKPEGITLVIDGKAEGATVAGKPLEGSVRTEVPLRIGRREVGAPFAGGAVQDLRIYQRRLTPLEARGLQQAPGLHATLKTPLDQRKPEQKTPFLNFYLDQKVPELQALAGEISAMETEETQIKGRSIVTHIQEEKAGSEPMAHILMRGQYDKPGEEVKPATIAALHPFPQGAPANRLGLAQWLVARGNPLTARVTVNRFWQELFGTGIVRTSEDFGIMGDQPTHPELLDWLATEFRESGWDVKKLFTLMVTSSTYRQSAVTTPEKRERDPQNKLLSRGPRFRMDAEMVRDYALAASGTLVGKIGGPSVKPYQPEGIWEAVAMPESNTKRYQRDTGESLYRRSLYTFWKRAAPPALMDVLNAPSRETCSVRRERTNTPLQALATMNDPQFVEAARRLSQQAIQAVGEDPEKSIAYVAERVLLRPLKSEESKVIRETYDYALREFDERPASATAFITIGESKPDPAVKPITLAALTVVANQLLSLDEALNK